MSPKKFITCLAILFFTVNVCGAEEHATVYNNKLSVTEQTLEFNLPPEEIPPEVFTSYTPGKSEEVLNFSKNHIDAIDPNAYNNRQGNYYPGGRGSNQLIIYTSASGEHTKTNEFGAEAVVVGNTVVELSGADSVIPQDGVVISGHGKAKTWINKNIRVGTKIYIDRNAKDIYAYTTSESYIFETQKKIAEAEQMIQYYRSTNPNYNWKVPYSYITDAKNYVKKARRCPDEVQKYSKLAIEASNDALKSVLPYRNNELRGVWLRPTEKTPAEITATLNRLNSAGINNVFLETYYHGKTIFPSKTMEAYGFTVQNENFTGFDPLAVWIKEAHKRGIKVHTWFETFYAGNQNPNDNPKSILAMNPSWGNKTKKDANGTTPSKAPLEHNGYFLDPANPYVQDFLYKLMEEIITSYKPDGINIDYIRYPNSLSSSEASNWGYTETARNDFKSIYGIDPIFIKKTDAIWADWNKYRQEQITNMVKKAGQLGRQTNTYISAVIFPDRITTLNSKQQDWKTWTTREYIKGFTPLLLTCDAKMASSMMNEVIKVKSPNTDVYPGLFVTFMNGSDEDLIRIIHETRKMNVKGVVLFDYAHINDKYISTLSKSVFAKSNKNPNNCTVKTEPKNKGWWIFK